MIQENAKEICDDLLVMLEYHEEIPNSGEIMCGPDHKIGKKLIQLKKSQVKYDVFLPEFPCLHT